MILHKLNGPQLYHQRTRRPNLTTRPTPCTRARSVKRLQPNKAFEFIQEFLSREEPANALSLPTWVVHVSSVLEWATAMILFRKYAEVTGNQRWKAFSWGMLPALGSAMCACTWHFFYNAPTLEYLVAVQAGLTIVGNITLALAAWHVYQGALQDSNSVS